MSFGRIILLLAATVVFAAASEPAPKKSNREIFFQLCDSLMKEISLNDGAGTVPTTVYFSPDTFSTAFRPLLIGGLTGMNVAFTDSIRYSGTTLELIVRESSVFFGEVFTESFFGTRKVERRITLSVAATSSADGKFLWSKNPSLTVVDTVEYSAVEHLSDRSIPLTSYQNPTLSFLDSIFEPAIVTIASGVAIYLFFTIRS